MITLGRFITICKTHTNINKFRSQLYKSCIDRSFINSTFCNCFQCFWIRITSKQRNLVSIVSCCLECLIYTTQTGIIDRTDKIQIIAALQEVFTCGNSVIRCASICLCNPFNCCITLFIQCILISLLSSNKKCC